MLEWIEKKVNNIETNPIDFWFAIDMSPRHMKAYRYFYIIPQYPSKDGVIVRSESSPELYVLFEGWCSECDEDYDKDVVFHGFDLITSQGRFYDCSKSLFLRAFKTIEEAQRRAEFNVQHMNALRRSFAESEIKDK